VKTYFLFRHAALAALLILWGIAPATAGEDIPAWAHEQLLAPWYAAYNEEDAEGIADLYTADANVGSAIGRSAIIASFEAEWADANRSCSGGFDGFRLVGDLATGWGHDVCIVTPKAGGESKTVNSRWLAVYEHQADGSWLTSRDIGQLTSYMDGFLPAIGHWSVDEEHRATSDAPLVKATSEWDIKFMPGDHFVDTSGSRTFSSGEVISWIEVWGVDPRNNKSFQHFVDTSGSFGSGTFEWVDTSWRSTVEVVSGDGTEMTISCTLNYSDGYSAFDGTCSGYQNGESWIPYTGKGKRTD